MTRITNTIDIAASPHAVYAALRDLGGYPSWLRHSTVYHGTALSPGGAPVRYEDSTMVGRMRGELDGDQPDHELRFHQAKASGALDARIRYVFDGSGDGTHVVRDGDMTTHGMLRVVQPVLLRMAAHESKRTLAALKAHMEGASGAR